jgi:tRNA A37 threonylcarbamoyladenosine synthetase subunit TsaC/SUA5/YrdC
LSNFGPLTCTSANIHGKPTPTVINDIQMQFKDSNISVYIDNGKLQSKASTIIDLTFDKPIIIREGAITKKEIMDMI